MHIFIKTDGPLGKHNTLRILLKRVSFYISITDLIFEGDMT